MCTTKEVIAEIQAIYAEGKTELSDYDKLDQFGLSQRELYVIINRYFCGLTLKDIGYLLTHQTRRKSDTVTMTYFDVRPPKDVFIKGWEVGQRGLSPTRVRQIQFKALSKMKSRLRTTKLDFTKFKNEKLNKDLFIG